MSEQTEMGVFGRRMNEEFEKMSEMNSMMAKKGVRWRRKIGKKIEADD